jgi:hypothetical protein
VEDLVASLWKRHQRTSAKGQQPQAEYPKMVHHQGKQAL